jgi:RNA polymerase sigma factor (TIGR02999 family)
LNLGYGVQFLQSAMPAAGPFGEITRLLGALKRGDAEARSRLASLVYAELHARAALYMRGERLGHTLQPTALVNETFMRLLQGQNIDFHDRAHFFAIASTTMRRVLVDHARARAAAKREGEKVKVELEERHAIDHPQLDDVLILDQALTRLAEMAPGQAALVEMIYFGGLTKEEAAAVLGVSPRTVQRDWASARAWLQAELRRSHP